MGKSLIQQRRGKGSIFESLKHQFKGSAKHAPLNCEKSGVVSDFIRNKINSAPLMQVNFGGSEQLLIAPEGVCVGDVIDYAGSELKPGNCMALKDIPEGTFVFNIEQSAGDGGKFVRAGGSFAKVAQKTQLGVEVILPSKKIKVFNPECRASIGVIAGGGRTAKPLMKAGNSFFRMRARHKNFPKVRGLAMNSVNHPFGGKCSKTKGKASCVSRNAPPGRKVGKIAPSRTGRRR
jgi:large subunit ribosomal protein L2